MKFGIAFNVAIKGESSDSLSRAFDTPKYVLHNINKVNRHSRIYLGETNGFPSSLGCIKNANHGEWNKRP